MSARKVDDAIDSDMVRMEAAELPPLHASALTDHGPASSPPAPLKTDNRGPEGVQRHG
jgi:hypothetical protein